MFTPFFEHSKITIYTPATTISIYGEHMSTQKEIMRKKLLGLCMNCGKKLQDTSISKCQPCTAKANASRMARIKLRQSLGLCKLCGINPPADGRKSCSTCSIRQNVYKNSAVAKIRTSVRNKLVRSAALAAGRCVWGGCTNAPHNDATYCKRHLSRKKTYKRPPELLKLKRDQLKTSVLAAYGGICACCGISDMRILTIDHISNDGASHRRGIKGTSSATYRWLKKNGHPTGFQVLCFNCNMGKAHNDLVCPHIKLRDMSSKSYTIRYNYALKCATISAYGGGCANCGESRTPFLAVNHINHDGAKHRESIGISGGSALHRWLKIHGYPNYINILCHNCNILSYINRPILSQD